MTLPHITVVTHFLEAISDLETTIENLFDSFCCNNFKVNSSKCHLFLSLFNLTPININNYSIEGSSSQKFIGVTFDSNFIFEKHINEICKIKIKNYMPLPDMLKHEY